MGELREQLARLNSSSAASIDEAAAAGNAAFSLALTQSEAFNGHAQLVGPSARFTSQHTWI